VRHFSADEPAADAVERVAKVFRDTQGDLPAVHRALIDLPQAWLPEPHKYKTPHELVVSTWRALDHAPPDARQIVDDLQTLGQRPFTPRSPAGWPDEAAHWDGPDALLKRIEWLAQAVAHRDDVRAPLDIARDALGSGCRERTQTAVARAASAAQALTLAFASPEFQRR
jgi:uncharacterized protein (DUF1800 family)